VNPVLVLVIFPRGKEHKRQESDLEPCPTSRRFILLADSTSQLGEGEIMIKLREEGMRGSYRYRPPVTAFFFQVN
jgi:hypothetical protein